jgi:hypothetical protein
MRPQSTFARRGQARHNTNYSLRCNPPPRPLYTTVKLKELLHRPAKGKYILSTLQRGHRRIGSKRERPLHSILSFLEGVLKKSAVSTKDLTCSNDTRSRTHDPTVFQYYGSFFQKSSVVYLERVLLTYRPSVGGYL